MQFTLTLHSDFEAESFYMGSITDFQMGVRAHEQCFEADTGAE